jgi:hypothetical protein
MYIGCHTRGLVFFFFFFFSYFNEIWNLLTVFLIPNVLHEIQCVGVPLIHADRQTVTCDKACPVVHTDMLKNGIALCLYLE